jgi:hypothetical protein
MKLCVFKERAPYEEGMLSLPICTAGTSRSRAIYGASVFRRTCEVSESIQCISSGWLLLSEQVHQSFGALSDGTFLSNLVERLVLFLDVVLILVVYVYIGTFDISQA